MQPIQIPNTFDDRRWMELSGTISNTQNRFKCAAEMVKDSVDIDVRGRSLWNLKKKDLHE